MSSYTIDHQFRSNLVPRVSLSCPPERAREGALGGGERKTLGTRLISQPIRVKSWGAQILQFLSAFLIKQLFHSRLLEIVIFTISYPTRARGIIVK